MGSLDTGDKDEDNRRSGNSKILIVIRHVGAISSIKKTPTISSHCVKGAGSTFYVAVGWR